jgi:hypothetical protein
LASSHCTKAWPQPTYLIAGSLISWCRTKGQETFLELRLRLRRGTAGRTTGLSSLGTGLCPLRSRCRTLWAVPSKHSDGGK